MHDTKERLSLLWLFALLNYLYADVLALFLLLARKIQPHVSHSGLCWVRGLMEIPIAMILASRLLPFRANRLANIAAGGIETLAVVSMQFVFPLATGAWHEQMFPWVISSGRLKRCAPRSSFGRRGLGRGRLPACRNWSLKIVRSI